mgnify:CR=1 FL=1
MTRTLLTALFLTLFSQTAWASDVYLCKKSGFVYTNFKTAEIKRGGEFAVAKEDPGTDEKPIIPTISDYDFKFLQVKINKRETLIFNNRQFLKRATVLAEHYYEVNEDGTIGNDRASLLFPPRILDDAVDRILALVSFFQEHVSIVKANCTIMKK